MLPDQGACASRSACRHSNWRVAERCRVPAASQSAQQSAPFQRFLLPRFPLRDQIRPDNHGARWRRCIPWRGAGAAAAAPSCVDGARSAGVRPVHLAIPTDCPKPARNRGGRPGSCCQRQASAGAPQGGSSDARGCRCMHALPAPPPRVGRHGMTNRPLDATGWPLLGASSGCTSGAECEI